MSARTSGRVRAAAAVGSLSMLAALVGGCVSQPAADRANRRVMLGGLTQAEFGTALHVARREAAREDADVSIATASVVTRRRRALLGVHGHACPPGRLLRVRLVGSFPHARQAPTEGPDAKVGGEDIVADPATGQVCAHSYLTGRIMPDLAMVELFSG